MQIAKRRLNTPLSMIACACHIKKELRSNSKDIDVPQQDFVQGFIVQ